MNEEAGSYGRWRHIACWRVPAVIWLGLPDPALKGDAADFDAALVRLSGVALTGYAELSPALKQELLAHVMNKENWASATRSSTAKAHKAAAEAAAAAGAGAGAGSSAAAAPALSATAAASMAVSSSWVGAPGAGAGAGGSALAKQSGGGAFVLPRPGVAGAQPNALAGKTFVLTGVFPEVGGGKGLELGKARMKACIESFGGRVTR